MRAGQDAGKASSSPRSPSHLAVQRRMRAALAAFDAESERILLELETVRGRLLTDDAAADDQLAALQDELDTLAERMALAVGIRHLGWLNRRPRRPDHPAPWRTINNMRRKGRRRFIETYEFPQALHDQAA